jgi:hypothetical protein
LFQIFSTLSSLHFAQDCYCDGGSVRPDKGNVAGQATRHPPEPAVGRRELKSAPCRPARGREFACSFGRLIHPRAGRSGLFVAVSIRRARQSGPLADTRGSVCPGSTCKAWGNGFFLDSDCQARLGGLPLLDRFNRAPTFQAGHLLVSSSLSIKNPSPAWMGGGPTASLHKLVRNAG